MKRELRLELERLEAAGAKAQGQLRAAQKSSQHQHPGTFEYRPIGFEQTVLLSSSLIASCDETCPMNAEVTRLTVLVHDLITARHRLLRQIPIEQRERYKKLAAQGSATRAKKKGDRIRKIAAAVDASGESLTTRAISKKYGNPKKPRTAQRDLREIRKATRR